MAKNLPRVPGASQSASSAQNLAGRTWLRPSASWLWIVGVSLVVFALYSPSLRFQFILDDHRFTADPRIQNADHLWDYFTTFVWAQITGAAPSFYRPIFLLWMRLNYLINGLSPWGWHFLSVAKHIGVAVMLGWLVQFVLCDWIAALVAASLFAFHPAQTESVSWVTVPDPLMAIGLLLALLCYFRYWNGPSAQIATPARRAKKPFDGRYPERQLGFLLLSALVYLAALLAKETAIVFPAVVLVLGMLAAPEPASSVKRKFEISPAQRLRRALYHFVPFACATVFYLMLRLSALDGKVSTATQHLRWTTVILSWPATLSFYIRAMLWPVRSHAFADPILVNHLSASAVLLPVLLIACFIAAIASLIIWIRHAAAQLAPKESSAVDFVLTSGALLLFLPLLPALNLNALNPGDFLHGRYTYLPLAGLMLILASFFRVAGRMRTPALAAAGAIAISFIPLTLAGQNQWKDDLTVFSVAHELAPNNAPVARNLADARVREALSLEEDSRCSEAIPVFQQVSQEYPDDWYALAGLGYCYAQSNDFVRAESYLHRAADLSHDSGITQQWQELRTQMGLSPGQTRPK